MGPPLAWERTGRDPEDLKLEWGRLSTLWRGASGNLGRDLYYGPGYGAVDFSIFKRIPIKERLKAEFRVGIFNLFNRTNWANPNVTFSSSGFGQLTSTFSNSSAPGLGPGEPRNTQLALKILW